VSRRSIRSIEADCGSRKIRSDWFNERSLQRRLKVFLAYYHRTRTPLGWIRTLCLGECQLGKMERCCKYKTYAFMAFIQTNYGHRVSITYEKKPLNVVMVVNCGSFV
jgi:hypothetical protein